MGSVKSLKKKMISEIYLRSKNKYRGDRYLMIALVLNLLLLGEKIIPKIISLNFSYNKYIYIVYYCILIISIIFFLPAMHPMGKIKIKNYFIGFSIAGSFIYIAINFSVAILTKNLAASPYDTSIKGIVNNLATFMPKIIAFILVRDFSVNTLYKKISHPYMWIIILSLYLAALEFNYTKLTTIRTYEDLFIYFVKDILPKISLSFLMTTICLIGGSLPSIYYQSINRIFFFIFPFIPSLPWLAESVIGIAYPIILSLFLWEEYKILSQEKVISQKESIFSFTLSLVFMVGFSWFVVGVFSIYPSVILTGSMEPMIYPGDIVLIRKLTSEEEVYKLKAGDVINFKRDNITITHRIEEVKKDEAGNLSFVTKGDNNDSHDPWLVMPNDLKGSVENVIPKIGIPIVLLHSKENIPEGVMDY